MNKFFLLLLWLVLPLLEGLETTQGLGVYTKKKKTVVSFTTETFQTTPCPCSCSWEAARSIALCHLPIMQVLPDITYLRVESQWKSTLHHKHKDKYATLNTAEPYFSSLKAADQNVQHKPSITKWQSQFLKKGLHQARETCSLPAKFKRCKLPWSTQAPGFNLQTLPISINLSSWGLYWIVPHRSPLRDLSAILLIEELKAWGGHELSPSTGPATLPSTPVLF